MKVSVVVPVHSNAGTLEELHRRLGAVGDECVPDLEIVLVDDGSLDRSWDVIRELASEDSRVRGVRLVRNVGQLHAILAGVSVARGDVLAFMDADLGDAPEALEELLRRYSSGHDCVVARRRQPSRPTWRRLGSAAVNRLAWLAGLPSGDPGSSFLLLDRALVAPVTEAYRSTGVRLLLPMIVRLSERPSWVDVTSPPTGGSTYQAVQLVTIAGEFALVFVGPRLSKAAISAAALLAVLGGVQRDAHRRARLHGAALAAAGASLILLAAPKCWSREVTEPLFEVAELTGHP